QELPQTFAPAVYLAPFDRLDVPADTTAQMEEAFYSALLQSSSLPLHPSSEVLASAPDDARLRAGQCGTVTCLAQLAEALKTRFIVVGRVDKGAAGASLSALLFDAERRSFAAHEREEININDPQPWVAAADRLAARFGP